MTRFIANSSPGFLALSTPDHIMRKSLEQGNENIAGPQIPAHYSACLNDTSVLGGTTLTSATSAPPRHRSSPSPPTPLPPGARGAWAPAAREENGETRKEI